jgi:hypothetical protein
MKDLKDLKRFCGVPHTRARRNVLYPGKVLHVLQPLQVDGSKDLHETGGWLAGSSQKRTPGTAAVLMLVCDLVLSSHGHNRPKTQTANLNHLAQLPDGTFRIRLALRASIALVCGPGFTPGISREGTDWNLRPLLPSRSDAGFSFEAPPIPPAVAPAAGLVALFGFDGTPRERVSARTLKRTRQTEPITRDHPSSEANYLKMKQNPASASTKPVAPVITLQRAA